MKSTTTKMEIPQAELLNGQSTSKTTNNKTSNSNELIEKEEVTGTPFTIVKHEEKYYVVMGKYRLSEKFNSKAEAEKDAKREDWMRIMQVCGVMIENYEKNK